MSETPMIGRVIDVSDFLDPEISGWHIGLARGSSIDGHALATELRALLAERDALAAKLTPPVRNLREVKIGLTRYRVSDGVLQAIGFNGQWAKVGSILPQDAAAIADLYANPFEPVETVEEVFRERDAMAAVVEAAFVEGQRSMRSDYEFAGVEASYDWEHSDAKAALRTALTASAKARTKEQPE